MTNISNYYEIKYVEGYDPMTSPFTEIVTIDATPQNIFSWFVGNGETKSLSASIIGSIPDQEEMLSVTVSGVFTNIDGVVSQIGVTIYERENRKGNIIKWLVGFTIDTFNVNLFVIGAQSEAVKWSLFTPQEMVSI